MGWMSLLGDRYIGTVNDPLMYSYGDLNEADCIAEAIWGVQKGFC